MPPLARTGALASGTRTGPLQPVHHGPARDMPAAAGRAGPPGEQCDTAATGDTEPAGSARPQGPKVDVGDTAPLGDPRATSPQESPAAFGELTRVHSDEPTIPSGETNAATAIRPDGRSRRAAGMSSRPGQADRAGV